MRVAAFTRFFLLAHSLKQAKREALYFNTLWTGDADLRLYITTVQDG